MSKRSTQWHEELKNEVLAYPKAHAEYAAFKLKLELAEQLKQKRKKST